MKHFYITWLLVLGMTTMLFAQTEKTFVKTFPTVEGCPFALFTVNGPAVVYGWDQKTIQITVKVTTPEIEEKILEALFKGGRYEWQMRTNKKAQLMIFEMPHQEQFIFNNGHEIYEEFEYEIFVPRGIRYRLLEHIVPTLM